jgi:hypothetical protein
MKHFIGIITKIGLGLTLAASCGVVFGQVVVDLPDTSQTSSMQATVSEQAQVTVPADITFAVTNITITTAATAAAVTITNIALATSTKQLEILIDTSAADFTPPTGGGTIAATAVTWNASTGTAWTGASGTLANGTFNQVATCTAGVAACSTTGLVFTRAAVPTIQISGLYTLTVNWKFESIGS